MAHVFDLDDAAGVFLTMMLSNCSGVERRPTTLTEIWKACFWSEGGAPSWPEGTSTFCSCSAVTTSEAVSWRAASFTGSSQMRMAYLPTPKMVTSPTPFTRLSASLT